MSNLKEPLKTILRKYCQVETCAFDSLRKGVSTGEMFPYDAQLFKQQFREAIDNRLITPEEYEQLTDEDFDTQEDLQEWLEELWNIVNAK